MKRILIAGLCLLAVACGGDSATGASSGIAGTYTLRTADGAPLPHVLSQSATSKQEVLSDAYVLTSGGTWSASAQIRTTINGQASISTAPATGTYTVSGASISLRNTGTNTSFSGTIDGTTLTLTGGGSVLVYMK